MIVSQASISQQVGVSRTAVSHVLNGREHMVSEETRERILRAVEESGYHRNALVRALKANRTHVIGIVVPEVGLSFFAELIEGAELKARQHGLQCFLCQTYNDPAVIEKDITTLREYRVDGLIMVPASASASRETLATLLHQKFPFVVVDVPQTGLKTPYVGNDQMEAGRLATHHLLELGHRRIAIIRGYHENPGSEERITGYRKALAQAGVRFDKRLVIGGRFTYEGGLEAVDALMEAGTRFTGIVASSDYSALGANQRLAHYGLEVPRDVSIVGCGNLDISTMANPALTTIDQDPQRVGAVAVEMLLKIVEGETGSVRARRIAPKLITRRSTLAPAK